MEHTIVVSATASDPAFLYIAPYAGTAWRVFRDKGSTPCACTTTSQAAAAIARSRSSCAARPDGRPTRATSSTAQPALERAAKLSDKNGGAAHSIPSSRRRRDISAYIRPTSSRSRTARSSWRAPLNSGIRPHQRRQLREPSGRLRAGEGHEGSGGRLRLDLAQYRELAAFAMFASDSTRPPEHARRGQRLTEILKQLQYAPLPWKSRCSSFRRHQRVPRQVPRLRRRDTKKSCTGSWTHGIPRSSSRWRRRRTSRELTDKIKAALEELRASSRRAHGEGQLALHARSRRHPAADPLRQEHAADHQGMRWSPREAPPRPDAMFAARPYARKMMEVLSSMASGGGDRAPAARAARGRAHPARARDADKACAADSTPTHPHAVRFLQDKRPDAIELELLGRKGRDFFRRRHYRVRSEQVALPGPALRDRAEDRARSHQGLHRARGGPGLPRLQRVQERHPAACDRGEAPSRRAEDDRAREPALDYLYEPGGRSTRRCSQARRDPVWRALLESAAAEHGARMRHGRATRNAGDMIDRLTLYMTR